MGSSYKKVYSDPWFIIILCTRNITEIVISKENQLPIVHLAMERLYFSINECEKAMPIIVKTVFSLRSCEQFFLLSNQMKLPSIHEELMIASNIGVFVIAK
jgi:CTP:phosphocholine cytidylyltransferase-like protein